MLLIAIGAAYACYSANANNQGGTDNNNKKIKIDPSISLKGKTCIQLHDMEREMIVLELPIATISFFEGNYQAAASYLRQRFEQVLQANPFLAGRLLPMPDLQIVYDATTVDRPPDTFHVFEPGIIPLKHDTPYEMYTEMLQQAVVPSNTELLGQNRAIFKISIIPDAGQWDDKFAVVISMSHAVGDAHTYYKIYNMLSSSSSSSWSSSSSAVVQSMNPARPANYKQAIDATVGQQHRAFLNSLKESKRASEKEPPAMNQKISNTSDAEMKDSMDSDNARNPLLRSFKQHQLLEHSSSQTVMKLFFIDEEWVLRQKGRRGSVFEGAATVGQQATIVSANSIIASWFFRLHHTGTGMLMTNLRGRDIMKGCYISDLDAGNYVYPLVCSPDSFATAGKLQHAVTRSFRGEQVEESAAAAAAVKFQSDRPTSICVSWANFFREELRLDDESFQMLHLPLFNTTFLKVLPSAVSCITIFTARCASANDGEERRAGAFVICQDNVWKQILQSGIVEEMISEV